MDKRFDVICLGRIAIDFNPTDIHRPLEESCNFVKYVGGSPANIAVGLARLGKKVGFVGKVSDDQFGRYVTGYFNKNGIDTSGVSIAKNGESLGLTFTEIKSETESSILMYRNCVADLSLEPGEVDEEYIKSSRILVVSGTALAKSPSREAAFTAITYAKKHGVKIVFDIDYRNYTWASRYEIAVYYALAASQSDIVIGSREEFGLTEALVDPGNADDDRSAQRWIGAGNGIVVIKHGKEGSMAYVKEENAEKGYATYHIKPFPASLLKSFGGGDGYASAFLYGLLSGYDVEAALQLGSASAAMLVSAHSCSEAMPTEQELMDFYNKVR